MPEIAVSNLSKSFGPERALDAVCFEVHDGEFLTLLGPSGCGKTTTLMSLAGFQRPDSGSIVCGGRTFFDHDARVDLAAEKRNLGIVFQSYAIWPHMTVAQNVAFPLKVRKLGKREVNERVQATLELVELSAYRSRYPHELSGGQQQRVALARSLAYSPSVLLLDEPFSNLDAKLRERARIWLKHLQAELGLTTVFVTHDQDEALSLSDRILVMDRGVILQSGAPEAVYQQPRTRFVAEFLGQCNILTGRIAPTGGARTTCAVISPGDITLELADCGLHPGDKVEIAIRPEAIVFEEPGQPTGPNTFAAQIRTVSFLGDHYAYELAVNGIELAATAARALQRTRVTIRVPPEACRVLGRDGLPAERNLSDVGASQAFRTPL